LTGFLTKLKENKEANVAAYGGYTVIHTDGGCQTHHPHIGAWAWSAHAPGQPFKYAKGAMLGTTNNRMELLAIYRALEELEIGPPIKLYSDSMYAINSLTIWGPGWFKKGWKNSEGNPVKNRDLIEPLLMLVGLHQVEFLHVKGHSTNIGNNLVDSLCVKAIVEAEYAWKNGVGVFDDMAAPS